MKRADKPLLLNLLALELRFYQDINRPVMYPPHLSGRVIFWYNTPMTPDRNISSLPASVQVTAHTHIAMLASAMPGWLDSYYFTGSVALGAFQTGISDVDFVAIVTRCLKEGEPERLKSIHRSLHNRKLFSPLDGFYVTEDQLRPAGGATALRFNDGRFQGLTQFAVNSPDGWVLKRHGVCIVGRPPDKLPYLPDWEHVANGIRENLDTYWRGWVNGCRNICSPRTIGLLTRPDVLEWGVLGISRLYFSLRERDVASKTEAGEYALQHVPERWHPILREALRRRNIEIKPQYRSAFKRWHDVLAYMDFIRTECSKL